MSSIILFPEIDFADSRFRSIESSDKTLTVYLESWDAKTIKVTFLQPIRFSFKRGDISSDIYEVSDSEFLQEALHPSGKKTPVDGQYKLFQIWDINDYPYLQVVALEAAATKENT